MTDINEKLIEELTHGKRRMPMNEDFMTNKKVDAEFYGKLQLSSFRKQNQKERYIEDMNVAQWVKDFGLTSRATFYRKIKPLVESGVVLETKNEDGGKIYKLPITKGHYTLIEYENLRMLTNAYNSDSIKVYMLCKVFSENYGRLTLSREQILERIGLNPTRKLLVKIDDIMNALEGGGFIIINKREEIKEGKSKKVKYTISLKRG